MKRAFAPLCGALCGASLCFTAIGFTAVAHAESDAEELIALGINLRREHRDAAALDAFERAYAQRPSPRALAQVALAEQALSSWVRAESDLERALGSTTDPWILAHTALLNHALASIRDHLATLTVESTPGVQLFLNGAEAGRLPLGALRVPAGPTTVLLRLGPDRELSHRLEVPAGALLVDHVEFPAALRVPEAQAAQPASEAGRLRPDTADGSLHSAAAKSDRTLRTLAWCTLGAAGSVLGAAVTAEIVHQSAAARYNDDQKCAFGDLSRDQRCGIYRGRAETTRVVATSGYIGTGALAVASLLLFWNSSPRPPASAAADQQPRPASEPWIALDTGTARWGWRGTW